MLDDIKSLTTTTFDKFILDDIEVNSAKVVYDVYRHLCSFIDDIKTLSEHYLALDFTEHYLQSSSFGEPSDKWRFFFNKDLERLNNSAKEYLLILNMLSKKDDDGFCSSFLSSIYNAKHYYSFVRDEYNVGFVEPCGFDMISTTLKLNIDSESYYQGEFTRLSLKTFDDRKSLQSNLRLMNSDLKNELKRLKEYILNKYELIDLM